MNDEACRRCGGKGELSHFRHVMGGVCFRCWGSGFDPKFDQAESLVRWLERARKEYRNLVAALRASAESQRGIQKQINVLTREGKRVRAQLDKLTSQPELPFRLHSE